MRDALIKRALAYEKNGMERERLDALLDALRIAPATPLLLDEIGRWFLSNGKYGGAALWFSLSHSIARA